MAQIQDGTVTVEFNNSKVVASAGVDWQAALDALNHGSPVYFSLRGPTEVPRQVTAIAKPSASDSGTWELTLVTPWDGEDQAGASYILHKDFTLKLGLPLVTPGDSQTAQLWNRLVQILDRNWGGASLVPQPLPVDSPLTPLVDTTVPGGVTLYAADYMEVEDGVFVEALSGATIEAG